MEQQTKTLRRELALVRVVATGNHQDQALDIVGAWSGRLLELRANYFTAELAGDPDLVTRFIQALAPFGSVTSTRSGAVVFE